MTSFLAPTSKELGALIRGYRKQRGWTQAHLAAQVGLFPKTISALEAGGGNVLLSNVMRCLSALEVDIFLAQRRTFEVANEAAELLPNRSPDEKSAASLSLKQRALDKGRKERW